MLPNGDVSFYRDTNPNTCFMCTGRTRLWTAECWRAVPEVPRLRTGTC